jgi:hypothetical protein
MTTPTGPVRGGGRFLPGVAASDAWVAGAGVLIAVGIAQLADLVTFMRLMAAHGVIAEANPLVAHGYGTLGLLPLIAGKVALIVLIATVFAVVSRRRARLSTLIASAGMVAGLLGAYSNVAAL